MESDSETRWKTDIVQRLNDFEVAKQETEQRAENFCAVNTAMSKEVDRLKYLQQLQHQIKKFKARRSNCMEHETVSGLSILVLCWDLALCVVR